MELPDGIDPPASMETDNTDIFGLFSPTHTQESFIDDIAGDKKKYDVDTSADLIATGDSVDLWSLANDSQNPSMTVNLTSIHEEGSTSKDSELFLSPGELFLQNPVDLRKKSDHKLQSSPIEDEQCSETSSKKRKLSDVTESPCKLLATRIDSIASPEQSASPRARRDFNTSKLWSPSLDAALAACYRKYRIFKESQLSDSVAFKYTSQNKILSRMLFNKTGVIRSPKQVSSRILRLNKNRLGESERTPEAKHKTETPLADSNEKHISSSPIDASSLTNQNVSAPHLTLDQFTMSFNYNSPIQGVHNFAKLVNGGHGGPQVSNMSELKKILLINNAIFSSDYDKIAAKLFSQSVPIYLSENQINLKPAEDATSTPTSPLTNPRSFTIENGNFLCHLGLKLAPNVATSDFISWKSCISIYKDDDKVLLRSRELINGYKSADGSFQFQVPFLNNFWAGYLTFLCNGSNDFKDLKSLHIVQVIYEGDDESFGKIHSYLTYRFEIAKLQKGISSVTLIKLDGTSDSDLDDNATVLASSSPVQPVNPRSALSVNTTLANTNAVAGPMSIPTYNASVLRKFNPNYHSNGAGTPMEYQPGSAISMYPSDVPFQTSPETLDTPASINVMSGNNQSAGQIMVQPSNNIQAVEVIQSAHYEPGMHSANQAHFPTPIQHLPGTSMPNGNIAARYVPSVPMVPQIMNDGTIPNVRYEAMSNPSMGPQPPVPTAMVPGQQWGMMYQRPEPIYAHPPINSAPASQIQFFPQTASASPNPGKSSTKQGTTITFGPILGYDPSKDVKERSKRTKPGIHKFLQNPQVMYKPKKK